MNIAREAREKLQFTLLYRRKRDQRDGPVTVFGYNRPLNSSQEGQLAPTPVRYDPGGWDTVTRTLLKVKT